MIIMALDSGKTRTSAVAIDEGFNVLCKAEGRGGGLIYSNNVIKDALVTTINRCLRSMGVGADSVRKSP